MSKNLQELLEIATTHGVTVDELLREKKLGAKVDKPFTLAIRFDRLQDLVDFVNASMKGVCVWKADGMDGEFGTRGGSNNYVLRGNTCSKPEEMRVTYSNGRIVGVPPTCPRCENLIPNNDEPGAYPGAISRVDNETEVCSSCGVEEALLQFQGILEDWRN